MKRNPRLIAKTTGAAVIGFVLGGIAHAGPRCHVPLADWQPREALQDKMRLMGWTISRIKTDDGCYKVYGTNDKGLHVKAKFNPATLDMITRDDED